MPRSQPSLSKSRPSSFKSQPTDATPNKRKAPSNSPAISSQRLSAEDIDELVKNTIVYVLSQDHHKMPIKRTDITRHAMKLPGKMYNTIMKEVQKELNNVSRPTTEKSCLFTIGKKNKAYFILGPQEGDSVISQTPSRPKKTRPCQ